VDRQRDGWASLQLSLEEQSTLTAQLEEKLATLQADKETRGKELQACTSRLSEAGRVMEAFHAEKERFRLKTMDLQRELDAVQRNLVEKESDFVELEGKVEVLHSALDASKNGTAELERKYAAKHEEIEELQCKLTQIGAELTAANKEVDRHKIIHSKQMEDFESVRQALIDQAALVAEAEETVESLREEVRLKEAAAQDLVGSLEQQMLDLSAHLAEKEGECQDAKSKHAQMKMQYDALSTRCSELDEENARTTAKLDEYDGVLQTKGRELAKLHGSQAEARSLAEDAELRVQSMKVMEDKLRREIASKDKQLKSVQQSLLDGSIVSIEGGSESLEGKGMVAAMETEYALLQQRFESAQHASASVQREAATAKRESADLQERFQSTELQVVSLKLEIDAKQSELDGLYGKVSRLQLALSAHPDTDDTRSKATTARVTPTRGFEASGDMVHSDVALHGHHDALGAAQQLLAAAREEVHAVKQELEATQKKLKQKTVADLARLTVRCHKSVLRREEEHERHADLQQQVQTVKDFSQGELCELQRQLVEKTNLLLASEKKFGQLLAWVQKNKASST